VRSSPSRTGVRNRVGIPAIDGRDESFRRILENGPDVVLVVGRDLAIRYRSHATFGSLAIGADVTRFADLLHAADGPRVAALVDQLARTPGRASTLCVRVGTRHGTWHDAEATFTNLLQDELVGGIVVRLHDVDRWVALEQQLRRQAVLDPLTGLPNRVLFRDRLEHALVRSRDTSPVALLFLDIDRFKAINDSLGHAAGDQLLVMIAERLRTVVRSGETIARFGGDEFAVLMEDFEDPSDTRWVANRIIDALQGPFSLGDTEVHVNTSVGIALHCDGTRDADELFRNADVAMYEAKGNGGGCCAVFEPQMQVAVRERLELENDLRRAVERNELFVQYQPLVDLETKALCGVEALVRWRHPRRGVLQPLEFISLAEESGLIVPIGAWVLERACREVQGWQSRSRTDPPLKLSVNLSVRELHDPSVADRVAHALHRSGLDPAQLVLELTESSLLEAADGAADTLRALKRLGVRLAIDDFGTGYSCLSYLQRLPVDILKIDRAFVSGPDHDTPHTQWAFAQTIVQLAANLGLATTAEGIEDTDQWDALVAMGCQTGQGFHFAHPVDPIDIENLLLSGRQRPDPTPARDTWEIG
jgi:diguanylate cyclase (GGDEF)-like protein